MFMRYFKGSQHWSNKSPRNLFLQRNCKNWPALRRKLNLRATGPTGRGQHSLPSKSTGVNSPEISRNPEFLGQIPRFNWVNPNDATSLKNLSQPKKKDGISREIQFQHKSSIEFYWSMVISGWWSSQWVRMTFHIWNGFFIKVMFQSPPTSQMIPSGYLTPWYRWPIEIDDFPS